MLSGQGGCVNASAEVRKAFNKGGAVSAPSLYVVQSLPMKTAYRGVVPF